MLSEDEEEEEGEGGASAGGVPRPASEALEAAGPAEKRPKTEALDFAALQRAGYSAGPSEEAERSAAAASLRCSFAALEQQVADANPKQAAETPDTKPTERRPEPEFGCELPPDSIEVFDECGHEVPPPWSSFEEAEEGLGKNLVDVMRGAGFEAPTPIQANTWPILASGRDLIGVAKTGSGKTLAFLLPFFARLLQEGLRPRAQLDEGDLPVQMQKQAAGAGNYSPDILVLAPSRELAMQIEMEAQKFTGPVGIDTLACYGGEGLRKQQLGRLRERPQCVVGTIGRLNDFLDNEKHWFGVKNVRFLILDEADHMLGEGLSDPIRKITVDVETPRRQTAMFSATFADEVADLASWVLRLPVEVRVGMRDPLRANRDVDQKVVIVKDDVDKEGALKTILRQQYSANAKSPGKVLIFAADPEECDTLGKKMKGALNGCNVEVLHGNRKQSEREEAMAAFRSGKAPMLVATSVAGRGLDVKDIQLVVNFAPPEDGQEYVHRVGRTGRAGHKGKAITLLRKGPDGRAMIFITQVMRRTGLTVPMDLIDALKQRRGRDSSMAAEVLQGLVAQEKVDRSWAKCI